MPKTKKEIIKDMIFEYADYCDCVKCPYTKKNKHIWETFLLIIIEYLNGKHGN